MVLVPAVEFSSAGGSKLFKASSSNFEFSASIGSFSKPAFSPESSTFSGSLLPSSI